MSDDGEQHSQWWTPTGWESRPAPPEDKSGDPKEHPLTRMGFERMLTFGYPETQLAAPDLMRIDIWYGDDAYHVALWSPDIRMCGFYVHRAHEVQFFTQMLPGLVAGYAPWLREV